MKESEALRVLPAENGTVLAAEVIVLPKHQQPVSRAGKRFTSWGLPWWLRP